MNAAALVDYTPALHLALLAALIACLPLSWLWLRQRGADPRARYAALAALTLFLTFDLVVFGAYTRLSDSGLGCPDWPGCYGQASPLEARAAIDAAQGAQPAGPVTWSKAWIEMIHRYLAMTVGALVVVMTAAAWRLRGRLAISPAWPTLTLLWIVVQGLFGRYTVTWKLYPAIVTAHLLGGVVLLMLLAVQHAVSRPPVAALPPALRRAAVLVLALLLVQLTLGGWVSTNYAVLACSGFPTCNGAWWPAADFGDGYAVARELGRTALGAPLPFTAMVAIHMGHRLFAAVAACAVGWLAWHLWRSGPAWRRPALVLAGLLLLQLISGVSNVVLGWPLVAALAHTAGAAALALSLTLLLAGGRAAQRRSAARAAPAASAA